MSDQAAPATLAAAPRAARVAPLSVDLILTWADEQHARTGAWPKVTSPGPGPGPGGEKWKNLDQALRNGSRGLPAGSSLARLLAQQRGVPNVNAPPPLTVDQVLAWADAFHARTGRWPTALSGPIPESEGNTWRCVAHALAEGLRGLPGGTSLARLLAQRRGYRNPRALPPLTEAQILAWADDHRRRTRQWPTRRTPGAVAPFPPQRNPRLAFPSDRCVPVERSLHAAPPSAPQIPVLEKPPRRHASCTDVLQHVRTIYSEDQPSGPGRMVPTEQLPRAEAALQRRADAGRPGGPRLC